jgi:hypothetical protein
MPYLGPGVAANPSLTPISTLVFTPTPSVQASCRFVNTGTSTVYIGTSTAVTPGNGFPLPPGNRPLELQNVNVSLYACSSITSTAAPGTVSTATVAGVTGLTVATVNPGAAAYVKYGNGSAVEYVQVNGAITGSGPWTVPVTATILDHGANSTAATVTFAASPLTVQAGVV